ncbi:hypothetical protein M422DRAFT_251946 [Sphaerobolus stellatus SS14]|uniref:Uncharacterized protein n=1 Tax=Sphaerobolus stellatus (strain SS14) TaxID=990650 RepID=A0A0C9W136_SPHS4|nr:hypothetical protein M422DRAFT_251946 [Sphaerobolus stellatus SS14]
MSYQSSRSESRSLSPVHVVASHDIQTLPDADAVPDQGSLTGTSVSRTTSSRRSSSRSVSRTRSYYHNEPHNGGKIYVKYILQSTIPGGADRVAVSALTSNYQDALRDAIAVLGWYMPQLTVDNSILRVREYRNIMNNTEWVWADISPQYWSPLIVHKDEIGIFLKERTSTVCESEFIHGNIVLTYGRSHLGETLWTKVPKDNILYMKRPTKYEEANMLVLQCFAHHWKVFQNALKDFNDGKKRFIYYCFPAKPGQRESMHNRETWVSMPEEAYRNPDIWRSFVPRAGAALGVMLQ